MIINIYINNKRNFGIVYGCKLATMEGKSGPSEIGIFLVIGQPVPLKVGLN